MRTNSVVRARTDSDTKRRAADALQAMGLSVSEAIRLLLIRVANERRLPFIIQAPNSSTKSAMEELEQGKGKRFDSADELFEDLGI